MGFIKWMKKDGQWKQMGYIDTKPAAYRAELLINMIYAMRNREYEAKASIYVNSLHNPLIGYMSEEERKKMILRSKILPKIEPLNQQRRKRVDISVKTSLKLS